MKEVTRALDSPETWNKKQSYDCNILKIYNININYIIFLKIYFYIYYTYNIIYNI